MHNRFYKNSLPCRSETLSITTSLLAQLMELRELFRVPAIPAKMDSKCMLLRIARNNCGTRSSMREIQARLQVLFPAGLQRGILCDSKRDSRSTVTRSTRLRHCLKQILAGYVNWIRATLPVVKHLRSRRQTVSNASS